MTIGNDSKGGINKIAYNSFARPNYEDNKYISDVFEKYSTPARNPDGSVKLDRNVSKWNSELAADEILSNWNNLSEPALKLFLA